MRLVGVENDLCLRCSAEITFVPLENLPERLVFRTAQRASDHALFVASLRSVQIAKRSKEFDLIADKRVWFGIICAPVMALRNLPTNTSWMPIDAYDGSFRS